MFSVKGMATLLGCFVAVGCASEPGLDPPIDAGTVDLGFSSDTGALADAGPADADRLDVGMADVDSTDADPLGAWSRGPDLGDGPRQETAVVALADELYVLGGFDEASAFGNVVEIYSPSTNAWRRGPDLPANMHHANAAVVDGKIYVIGFLGANFSADARVFRFDPATGWEALASMPNPRRRGGGATAVLGGLIYVVGGFRSLGAVPDFDVYDPATGVLTPLPPLPRAADHLVAAAIGDRIYAVGGRTGSITAHTTQVDVYDPVAGAWTLGPPMPTSRGGSAAAVIGTALYVFGGEGNGASAMGVFDQVERFDHTTNLWTTLRPMMPGRHGTGAAAIRGLIYVPGGAEVQAFGAVGTVAVFSP